MGSQVWSLLSLGVGLNLVLGALVAAFKLPIYLDSLGTVLVAALAGPLPALLAGGCGVALLGLTSPTAFAFVPVGAAVGLLAGAAARLGAFRRLWTAGFAGVVTGCGAAALSAPISAYVFGGVTGGGTDLLVALFRAAGFSAWQASFMQGLTVDSADKTVTFLLVYATLRALPHRATAAFPLAEKLPAAAREVSPHYQPQPEPSGVRASATAALARSARSPGRLPEAATGWKVLALLSLLLACGLSPDGPSMTALLGAMMLLYGVGSLQLTWSVTRRLTLGLLPLALSLLLIQGLIVGHPAEIRRELLGLSWSPTGLQVAWHFLVRVAGMVLALAMFLAATPLQRLAELLLRWRVPYPLVFVLLTGANLAERLGERWKIVEEAQEARGLHLHRSGLKARAGVMLRLLTPTLGAVFSELPLRAANLESRGLLGARPRASIPRAWTGEREPSTAGTLFYLALNLLAWSFLSWLSI